MFRWAFKVLPVPAPAPFWRLPVYRPLTQAAARARRPHCNAPSPPYAWPTPSYSSAQALPSKKSIQGPSRGLWDLAHPADHSTAHPVLCSPAACLISQLRCLELLRLVKTCVPWTERLWDTELGLELGALWRSLVQTCGILPGSFIQ